MEKYLKEKVDGKPRHYLVQTVWEFLELCTWLYSTPLVVFRGQRRDKPLLPSVARCMDYIRLESEIFHEFKREALLYLDYVPTSDWQWLAIAQHSGLPTRLLDWTKQPLAALWFTVNRPPENTQSGVVWAHCYDSGKPYSDEQYSNTPFEISKTYIYFPDYIFPFIHAQSSLFTVHHRENDGFAPMEEFPGADLLLSKIEIPFDAFSTIRYHLFRTGIHAATIFPGLMGLAKRIKYQPYA